MTEPALQAATPVAPLTLAQFTPLLGQQFSLRSAGGEQPAALVQAAATGNTPVFGRLPFALLFECPGAAVLPQGLFALAHPALGTLDVFLVPVGRSPAGVRYEAVFN